MHTSTGVIHVKINLHLDCIQRWRLWVQQSIYTQLLTKQICEDWDTMTETWTLVQNSSWKLNTPSIMMYEFSIKRNLALANIWKRVYQQVYSLIWLTSHFLWHVIQLSLQLLLLPSSQSLINVALIFVQLKFRKLYSKWIKGVSF